MFFTTLCSNAFKVRWNFFVRRTRNISLEMCQQKHLGKSVRALLMDHGVNMLLVA